MPVSVNSFIVNQSLTTRMVEEAQAILAPPQVLAWASWNVASPQIGAARSRINLRAVV